MQPDYLFELSEMIAGTVLIQVFSGDEIIYDETKEVEVLPHDYWQAGIQYAMSKGLIERNAEGGKIQLK